MKLPEQMGAEASNEQGHVVHYGGYGYTREDAVDNLTVKMRFAGLECMILRDASLNDDDPPYYALVGDRKIYLRWIEKNGIQKCFFVPH